MRQGWPCGYQTLVPAPAGLEHMGGELSAYDGLAGGAAQYAHIYVANTIV
jgi:hypothetical protein